MSGGGALEAATSVGGSGQDTRDARYLARLLHLGEIVEVAIPSVEQEAARDLVRDREDVRGNLMSARHRISKLLLRQGIVHSGGKPWTGKHQAWLPTHTFTTPGRQLAYDTAFDTMPATVDRRDRLDQTPRSSFANGLLAIPEAITMGVTGHPIPDRFVNGPGPPRNP